MVCLRTAPQVQLFVISMQQITQRMRTDLADRPCEQMNLIINALKTVSK